MAKSESEIKLTISDKERTDLKSAIEKLTEKKPGFNSPMLSDDETKIIDFLKEI